MLTIVWKRRRGSNSHSPKAFTVFKTDKLASLARLHDWSGQLDSNQRPPGSKPGTLIRLSYTQVIGRPGVIRTLALTRIRRALCRLSYWSLVIRARVDSLRSPFGRTTCVCRHFVPRMNSHFEVESLAACPLADRIMVWRDAWDLNPHLLDRQSSALAIKLPSLCVVEDRGLKPRSSPCKSDVLSSELIPRLSL